MKFKIKFAVVNIVWLICWLLTFLCMELAIQKDFGMATLAFLVTVATLAVNYQFSQDIISEWK